MAKLCAIFGYTVLIFVFFSIPSIAQNDPYAQEYRDQQAAHLAQDQNDLMQLATNLYFAAKCGVTTDAQASAVINIQVFQVIERSNGALNGSLFDKVKAAERTGIDKAGPPNACDYWKNNPEQVYSVRNFIAAEINTLQ